MLNGPCFGAPLPLSNVKPIRWTFASPPLMVAMVAFVFERPSWNISSPPSSLCSAEKWSQPDDNSADDDQALARATSHLSSIPSVDCDWSIPSRTTCQGQQALTCSVSGERSRAPWTRPGWERNAPPIHISRLPARISSKASVYTQLATASIPEFHADKQTRGWRAIIDMDKPIASSLTSLCLPLNLELSRPRAHHQLTWTESTSWSSSTRSKAKLDEDK